MVLVRTSASVLGASLDAVSSAPGTISAITKTGTGSSAFISSSRCGGSQDGISFLLDWKPAKRVDIYAGVLVSNVYGGLANGFFSTSTAFIPGTATPVSVNTARTQNYDPTVGIRIRF